MFFLIKLLHHAGLPLGTLGGRWVSFVKVAHQHERVAILPRFVLFFKWLSSDTSKVYPINDIHLL